MLKLKRITQFKKHHYYTIGTILLGATIIATSVPSSFSAIAHSPTCPNLKVIFARGSGAERFNSRDYQEFKASLEAKLQMSELSYEFDDLDYPAVSVSGENFLVGVGAFIGGGESYSFGKSIKQGISQLTSIVNSRVCKNTKYVIGGYSQGAIVVSGALEGLDPNRIIYAATFGDPKIFLPEGAGPVPVACSGKNLSEYRIYVPDCFAYRGLLGAKEPYASQDYISKLGTWCNKYDIFCSSKYSIKSHTSYVEDNLYEDASRLIFSKIASEFGFKNDYTSPHDTAILIDSTGSMSDTIAQYKSEALKLAKKTLESGGRVALYDYRDLAEGYTPVERCSFKTCTLELFQEGLNSIYADGGGDTPESLLSSSLYVMKQLDWRLGSTKSLVILTDAGYHSPDLDGTTFYDVQSLSKQIDPVNFYIITTDDNISYYQSLADATDGKVTSTVDDLGLLTETIMQRFDSLPHVEESPISSDSAPEIIINNAEPLSRTEYKINFTTDAEKNLVVLNDAILGVTDQNEITITDLDPTFDNVLTLIPLRSDLRGEAITIPLETADYPDNSNSVEPLSPAASPDLSIPKAPNTGQK